MPRAALRLAIVAAAAAGAWLLLSHLSSQPAHADTGTAADRTHGVASHPRPVGDLLHGTGRVVGSLLGQEPKAAPPTRPATGNQQNEGSATDSGSSTTPRPGGQGHVVGDLVRGLTGGPVVPSSGHAVDVPMPDDRAPTDGPAAQQGVAGPSGNPAGGAIGRAVAPPAGLIRAASDTLAPVTGTVAEVAAPVTSPALHAVAPLASPVTRTVGPVLTPLAPITTSVTSPLAPVTDALVPVGQSLAPITAPLAPVTAPLAPISGSLSSVAVPDRGDASTSGGQHPGTSTARQAPSGHTPLSMGHARPSRSAGYDRSPPPPDVPTSPSAPHLPASGAVGTGTSNAASSSVTVPAEVPSGTSSPELDSGRVVPDRATRVSGRTVRPDQRGG